MKKAKRMRMLVKTLSAAVLGVLVGTASADMSGMGGPAIPRELKESMSNSFGGDVILARCPFTIGAIKSMMRVVSPPDLASRLNSSSGDSGVTLSNRIL